MAAVDGPHSECADSQRATSIAVMVVGVVRVSVSSLWITWTRSEIVLGDLRAARCHNSQSSSNSKLFPAASIPVDPVECFCNGVSSSRNGGLSPVCDICQAAEGWV